MKIRIFGFLVTGWITKKQLASLRRARLYFDEKGEGDIVSTLTDVESTFRKQLNFAQLNDQANALMNGDRIADRKDIKQLYRINWKLRSHGVSDELLKSYFRIITRLNDRL